jgi:hemolysin activation/secretion protein
VSCRLAGWPVGAAVILGVAAVFFGDPAMAQLPPQAPPQVSPIPFIAPPAPPPVSPGLPVPNDESFPNLASSTPLAVTSVVVDGSSTLTPEEISRITRGLVGPAVPTSTIEAARLSLLRRYRDAGYPLVTVSASLGSNGRLRITVIEGRISEVKLDGDIGPAGTKVLQFLQNLVRPGPTSAAALERWLLLAQEVPGVSLQTVLRPSETEPGALILVARVSRKAVSGLVVADNRAYPNTGPQQILAVAGYNSLTSLGERTEISLYKSLLNNTQIFGQASFETFLGSSGLKLRVYGGAGNTQPIGTLAIVGYNGETEVGGAQLSYPLIYSRQQKLNLLGMFDLFDTATYQTTSGGTPTSQDRLRIFRIGADYALLDNVFGATRPAVNDVTIRVSHGIQGLGSTNNGSTTLSRLGSVMNFTSVSAQVSRDQTLFAPWPDATISLFGLVTGQASGSILPSEEQFHLGGIQFTRGFYAGELSGDNALAATAELRLHTSAQVNTFGTPHDIGLQFYAFYDWGEAWQNQALDLNGRLASAGLGVRTTLTRNVELDMEGLTRLTTQPETSSADVKPLVGQAFYWRVLVQF